MSEERFQRIDQRLDRLETGQNQIKDQLNGLDKRVVDLDKRVVDLDKRVVDLDKRVVDLDKRVVDLDHNMRVLHEDTIGRIKAIPGHSGPTREEFLAAMDKIDRRFDRLEAVLPVVREHSVAIRRHDAEIEALKKRPT